MGKSKLTQMVTICLIMSLFGVILDLNAVNKAKSQVIKKDPDADKTYKYIPRGSKREKEEFKKEHIPLADEKKSPPAKKIKSKQCYLTENPIEEIKKKGKRSNLKKGKPSLKNKRVKDPRRFRGKYNLKRKAKCLRVIIIDENGSLVKEHIVRGGEVGTKKGMNEVILWDGENMYGGDVSTGTYKAIIIIEYPNGKKEVKEFELKK